MGRGAADPYQPAAAGTGTHERRGKPNRIRDRSREKALLAATLAAQAEQTDLARRRLLTDGTVRLSELGPLDIETFGLFLGMLGDALGAAVDPGAAVTVATADGALAVTLQPTRDGATATIRTPDGTLRGPDHWIRIEPAAGRVPEPLLTQAAR